MIHTLYILATMVHVVRREIPPNYWLDLLFHHFLYPLKPLLLHASTFLTVFMARERYKAIRHPLEYRNATAGVSPWRTAAKYVAPMVLAAAAFVAPLYFEVGQRPIKEELVVTLENGSQYLVSPTGTRVCGTQQWVRVWWYVWFLDSGLLV